jgi:hypothetical protein
MNFLLQIKPFPTKKNAELYMKILYSVREKSWFSLFTLSDVQSL